MSLLTRNVPFPVILALRYLRSTRRDAFASFLSAVAAGGIALGVTALVLSLAVISGFQDALRGEILSRTPQIEVVLPPSASAASAEAARRAALGVPGVVAAQVQVAGGGWLVHHGRVQPVDMVGFEGRVPASFPGAAGRPEGLYVEAALAARWALSPGDRVAVVSPRPTLTPFGGPQPRLRSLPVAGTFRSGRTQEDKERIALPRAVAETLLGGTERRLEVVAAGLDVALAVAGRLPPILPRGSVVHTWQDLNRPLLFALRLEKAMMFVAVFLIVLVAELALIADLALIIASKRPEIGMLGAMGATPSHLRRAFLLLGGMVAGIGAAAGAALGVAAAWGLDRFHLVPVPGRVYFLEYVPFMVKGSDLALVLFLTLSLALLSSLYAAQRAASLDPVEAMRR
ncbi:MAG TPA: FtsX-like permease family protein [Thermoanaerobaculia bacterium]